MGRKSSAKSQGPQGPKTPNTPQRQSSGGINPLVIAVLVVAAIGIGVLAFWNSGTSSSAPAADSAAATSGDAASSDASGADQAAVSKAAAQARLGPRKQANLPPVPFAAYTPPRSHEVITAAYQFAAEHPEILSYVPCFCGCERSGHGANHDCFVAKRDQNGDVVEWDPHGVDCAVCIDVANRSRQMHASGASVRDIRTAIDKEFGGRVPTEMHTPHPPAPGAAHGAH